MDTCDRERTGHDVRTSWGPLDRHDLVVRRFAEACGRGDVTALTAVLGVEVVGTCDAGGLVPSPDEPLHGQAEVARLVTTLCGQAGVIRMDDDGVSGAHDPRGDGCALALR